MEILRNPQKILSTTNFTSGGPIWQFGLVEKACPGLESSLASASTCHGPRLFGPKSLVGVVGHAREAIHDLRSGCTHRF